MHQIAYEHHHRCSCSSLFRTDIYLVSLPSGSVSRLMSSISRSILIVALLILAGCGDAKAAVCDVVKISDWSYDCRSIYVDADVSPLTNYEPIKYVLSYDGEAITSSVIITRARYSRFFKNRPRTQLTVNGTEYVSDPNVFGNNPGGSIRAGDVQVPLTWNGTSHFNVAASDTEKLLDGINMAASRPSGYIEIFFTGSFFGNHSVMVPVRGFRDARARLR